MFQQACPIEAAFEEAENDESVLCAVLTGAGRYFCSGADVCLACTSLRQDADDHLSWEGLLWLCHAEDGKESYVFGCRSAAGSADQGCPLTV